MSSNFETELKKFEEARLYLEKGLANARERGEKSMLLANMLYFSLLFFDMGNKAKAVKVFSAVEALKARIAYSNWSTNKSVSEKIRHLIDDCLNDPLYADDVEKGKQIGLEQLIAFVMQ